MTSIGNKIKQIVEDSGVGGGGTQIREITISIPEVDVSLAEVFNYYHDVIPLAGFTFINLEEKEIVINVISLGNNSVAIVDEYDILLSGKKITYTIKVTDQDELVLISKKESDYEKFINFSDVVRAISIDGNDMYIGGDFTLVSDKWNNKCISLNSLSAALLPNIIGKFNTTVNSIALDGAGNIYCGGGFTTYDGIARQKIAKINILTGELDTTFDSSSGFDNTVYSIALDGAGNVYCGGGFVTYGGTARQRIAKLSATDASLDLTFDSSSGFGSTVNSIALDGSGNIYCGGGFTTYGATTRQRIAKLSTTDASLDATFNSSSGFSSTVQSIALDGSGGLYCGGLFVTYGATARQRIAKLSTTDASLDATFNSSSGFNATVSSIALDGAGGLYCGGSFVTYGGTARVRIAKLSITDASLDLTFDPSSGFNATVNSIALDGAGGLYCGGSFVTYGITTRQGIAKLSTTDASLDLTFDSSNGFNGSIYSMALDGAGVLYCGGTFTAYKAITRQRIAKFNLLTGKLDATFDSSIGFNSSVHSIALDGAGNVYCGGAFITYGATARQRIAKLSATDASLDATFDSSSGFNVTVNSIALDGPGNIYCGGGFTTYGATTRQRIAKLSTTDASLDATFNSSSGFDVVVYSIALDGAGNVYCGGGFFTYGVTARQRIAKLSTTDASLDATFNSSSGFDSEVYSIALDGAGNIYCGGGFTTYGGTARVRIAKLSATDASLDLTFDSSSGFDSEVYSIALDGAGNIYCGGIFVTYGITTRQRIAKLSTTDASLDTTFDSSSGLDNIVFPIALDGAGGLYCGGLFTSYKTIARVRIAKLSTTDAKLKIF